LEPSLVQIVGPDDQWILERQARQLVSKLPYARFVPWRPALDVPAGLVYYMNYALFERKTHHIDVGFFTHRDDDQQFLERARAMDHAVCMSTIYANWLKAEGVETVSHIKTGFDFYRFRPRLVVGVIGLLRHSRKGKHLVELVKSLQFVELRTTEGNLQHSQLSEFYRSLDYVLIPATIEGGPMSLLESLGIGTPVIAPDNVGMIPEFSASDAILLYPTGDGDALIDLLTKCYEKKCESQSLVHDRTLDHWAESHHELFRRLLLERRIAFPEPAPGFRFGMIREIEIPATQDTSILEEIIDTAAARLYFGKYDEARSLLLNVSETFPCVQKLLNSLPSRSNRFDKVYFDLPMATTKGAVENRPSIRSNCEPCPRILLIAHIGTLRDRMDKSHYYRYQALGQRSGVTLFGPGLPGYTSEMSVEEAIQVACKGTRPDLIIHGGDLRDSCVPLVSGLDQTDVPTAIELLDTWANPHRTLHFIRQNRFDIAMMQEAGTHLEYFSRQCPQIEFFWTPNGVDTTLFRDYGLEKIYDIILYGVLESNIYPFRTRLFKLLPNVPGLRVKLIQHPGYSPESSSAAVSGAQLSRMINQSWIGIATRSYYNCLLMKYLEIAASGTVVAGNLPESGYGLFQDCIIKLDEEMSDNEIIATLRNSLANKAELRRLISISSDRVASRFSTDAFADRVCNIARRCKVKGKTSRP
jgi:hypothetical protein